MGGILDKLDEWLRGLLIEGITGNLSGMFDTVNTKVGEIAGEVGQTPLAWNSGVFSMIRNLSETVIVPIAGVILTFVMCYELIQLVTEKNNLHDVDTWMFFKWIFKTFCAVLIVTNTWNIVMGIFDVGQSVVNSSAGVIIGNTSIDISILNGVAAVQHFSAARHDPEAHPMEAKRQSAEYPEPYIVKLSVLHAGGFENTIQDQRHDYGQYTFEEKCFDCFASCHR